MACIGVVEERWRAEATGHTDVSLFQKERRDMMRSRDCVVVAYTIIVVLSLNASDTIRSPGARPMSEHEASDMIGPGRKAVRKGPIRK